ncbi:hypothetical protein ACEQPO_07510 [Bacillus sp. SL00103]
MLQTASSFIQPLTNDRYESIFFSPEDDLLMVKEWMDEYSVQRSIRQRVNRSICRFAFALALSHQQDCQRVYDG